MRVGLLLVTHNRVGEELLATVNCTLDSCPIATRCLNVPADADPDERCRAGQRLLREIDGGDGVLILTDAYGSTPSNIANRIGESDRTAVVAGLNLPMLLRVLNYPTLGLEELQEKAISGGQDGIVLVRSPQRPAREI